MKKRRAMLAAAVLAGILMTGCGQNQPAAGWDADENSIYVDNALQVESALIYTSEKANDLYTQDGLTSFVKEQVAAYNLAQGAAEASENATDRDPLPVALKSCTLEGQTGKLVLDYQTAEDFVKFAQESGDNTHTVTALSVAEADGIPEDLVYRTPDGKVADISEVKNLKGGHAVIAEGVATVYTEGRIAYMSEGVTLKQENAVQTAEGKNCVVFK